MSSMLMSATTTKRDDKAILEAQIQLIAAGPAAIHESQSIVVPVSYFSLRARAEALGIGNECDKILSQALIRRLVSSESTSSAILVGKTALECIRYGIMNNDDLFHYLAEAIIAFAPASYQIWKVIGAVIASVDASWPAQLALSSAIIEAGFSQPLPNSALVSTLSTLPYPSMITIEQPGKPPTPITLLAIGRSNVPRGIRSAVSNIRKRAYNSSVLKSSTGLLKACAGAHSASSELTKGLLSRTRDVAIWTHYNLLVERAQLSAFNVDTEFDPVLKRRCVCGAIVLRILTLAAWAKNNDSDQADPAIPAPSAFPVQTPVPSTPLSAGQPSTLLHPTAGASSSDDFRSGKSVFNVWKEFWGEWLVLADQFNSLLVSGRVEFEEFVLMLVHSGKSYFGGSPLRSNAVVWLITQVMPLDVVKSAIANSFAKSGNQNSNLADNIIGIYECRRQPSDSINELFNASIACLVWRLRAIRKDFTSSALEGLNIEHIHETYGAWWKQNVASPCSIDFFNLDEPSCIKVAVVSNISSQVVSDRLIQFLNDEPCDSKLGWQTLPGQLVFSGHSKPLPTAFLINLNSQCRNRFAQTLQDRLFSGTKTKSSVSPPGVVETYIRLLYIAPYCMHNNIRKLCSFLESRSSLPACQMHTLLEMINYRLFRLLSHQELLPFLFQITSADATLSASHPLLVESVHALLLKIGLMTALPPECIREEGIHLPVVICRSILLGIAWHWKDEFHEAIIQPLLEKYWKICPHSFSAQTLRWMPKPIQDFFKSRKSSFVTISWSEAQAQARRPDYASLLDFRPRNDDISSYLSSNSTARQQFYCVAAMLWLQNPTNFETYEYNFQMAVSRIPFAEIPDATVALVKFLFDALDTGRLSPFLNDWSPIQLVTNLLFKFSWHFRLVPSDILIMILCDFDERSDFVTVLRALLFGFGEVDTFGPRIEALTGCDPGLELLPHWDDLDYFSRHIDYYTSFPETSIGAGYESLLNSSDDGMLPIYYGNVCFRMLPILDVVISRLIENNQTSLLIDVANRFQALYPSYHHQPITTILRLFRYYDGSPALDVDVRRALLRLAVGPPCVDDSVFSPGFLFWARQSVSDFPESELFSATYYQNLLLRLAEKITIVSLSSSIGHRCAQFFYEFRSDYDHTLSVCCLETISLPVQSKVLFRGFIDILLTAVDNSNVNSSAKVMQAFALISTHLPSRFHSDLIQTLKSSVCTQCLSIEEASPLVAHLIDSDWKSLTSSILDNSCGRLLSVLHHVFEQMPSLLAKFVAELSSIEIDFACHPIRLLFLCRTFVPFLGPSTQPYSTVSDALRFVVRSLIAVRDKAESASIRVIFDWLSTELPTLIAPMNAVRLAELKLLALELPNCCPKRILMSLRDN